MNLLGRAKAAELTVSADGDRLIIDGPRSSEAMAEELIARKYDVLAELASDDPEVEWRVATMLQQVGTSSVIPTLIARPGTYPPGTCLSCGEPIEPKAAGPSVRCGPCARAAWLVVRERDARLASRGGPPEPGQNGPANGQTTPLAT